MNKVLLWILATLVSVPTWAGTYLEFGGGVTPDRIWIDSDHGKIQESGKIGILALGYDYPAFENLLLDFQLRHESDPKQANENDLTSRESLNFSARLTWSGPYVELGEGFTNDRIFVDDARGIFKESGIINMASLGYDYDIENVSLDFQYRYEDDPRNHGQQDLTNRGSINLAAIMRF
jgi:hypothetical protein